MARIIVAETEEEAYVIAQQVHGMDMCNIYEAVGGRWLATHADEVQFPHPIRGNLTQKQARALKLARDYMSPGSVGHVLAELATTGRADLDALMEDVWRTSRESVHALTDMGALSSLIASQIQD